METWIIFLLEYFILFHICRIIPIFFDLGNPLKQGIILIPFIIKNKTKQNPFFYCIVYDKTLVFYVRNHIEIFGNMTE